MASLEAVVAYLDRELRTREVPDYSGAMNGLQAQNNGTVTHVAAAVDFSSATVKAAVAAGADLLLVHHGMFWSGATPLTGANYERTSLMLAKNLAVYASHIPLDLHPVWGNNALLARELGLTPSGGFAQHKGVAVGLRGESDIATSELRDRAAAFSMGHGGSVVSTTIAMGQRTKRWGICTGSGASSDTLREAMDLGLDTLIVGEGPHHTAVAASDAGIALLYLGHYATETLGVAALARAVAQEFALRSSFIDAPTGL